MANGEYKYVTNEQLERKMEKLERDMISRIDKLPTTYQVMFLIATGIVIQSILPVAEVAKAMLP